MLSTTSDGFKLYCHIRVLEACMAGTTSQDERRAALLIIRALTMGRPVSREAPCRAKTGSQSGKWNRVFT